ncbi:ABC transporter substrate-binding protein [Corynebacterium sp. ES2794-CONJ1]|uniref:ABC transporter substrate-binding protein n=1 Tax=unclassified Corynebacterium TaxID=2624378 RepID=UPI0021697B80|nr:MULTISPECIES: ABC transporter substrate-binding protein [unclassified Corynebacterium]MCS4490733.1 ABC transporter substrate-binding protein [Corynebacterium sp. ES2775-CONJ]MCS4492535.1 ABC transporter substrate-binding protein [Corynebacterium sp. ES2715-CONJ3]MCS4532636.1 ABC transporter substrate-binding protein [Corynebacterium sp. ES2730-CONJ]MCU9520031.1 ABC transporter substrate-binding protein [Corynebacterium sp. ES2794-CONJ1]
MTSTMKHQSIYRSAASIVTVGLLLSGCVTNTEGNTAAIDGESPSSAASNGLPSGWKEITPDTVDAIAALVPSDIAEDGKISIGTNPPFAPAEFKDSDGKIIGFDIDLARAAASVLGLELEVKDLDFSLILPQIDGGSVEFGASGFTDNEERRANFDFVDYFNAGIQWAAAPGSGVDPDEACGLTVAVQRASVSETVDVAERSAACEAAGKPAIKTLSFDSSDAAANAAILGRADAFSGDSPTVAWAVERSEDRLELVGDIFAVANYGWPVKKGSELAPALAAALQHLIDNGDYEEILAQWGMKNGLVEAAAINGQPIN